MAKDKPIIRRCLFCAERFIDAAMKHHYKDQALIQTVHGKSNCKHTSQLLAEGWTQTATGFWTNP